MMSGKGVKSPVPTRGSLGSGPVAGTHAVAGELPLIPAPPNGNISVDPIHVCMLSQAGKHHIDIRQAKA